jgi:peptidoglycan/xylan/chitin deacetylase (PgdA/CDA1 family)
MLSLGEHMPRQPLRARLKTLVLWGTGLLRRRETRQSGACVLIYHGVVPAVEDPILDEFALPEGVLRAHLSYLCRHYVPISLGELLHALRSGGVIDRRWVVVTFDDALRSQTERAASLLAEFRIPWCLAVPTGLVGSGKTIWSYELKFFLLRCWSKPTLMVPFGKLGVLPTATRAQRRKALHIIRAWLDGRAMSTNPADLCTALVQPYGEGRFREALARYGRFTLVDWPDLRRMADAGVEMLAHGHRHLAQRDWLSPEDRVQEILTPRTILRQRLGRAPRAFVYPYGVVSPAASEAVCAGGYECAFSTKAGRVTAETWPRGPLPRVNAAFDLLALRRAMLAP